MSQNSPASKVLLGLHQNNPIRHVKNIRYTFHHHSNIQIKLADWDGFEGILGESKENMRHADTYLMHTSVLVEYFREAL